MTVDFAAVRARHPLARVAARTGYPLADSSGDVFVACPMPGHDDSTPSMLLHLDQGRYHCFGCGATGDVIQWVRDIYGVDTRTALAMLDANSGRFPDPPSGAVSTLRSEVRQQHRIEQPDLDRTPPERVRARAGRRLALLHAAAAGGEGRRLPRRPRDRRRRARRRRRPHPLQPRPAGGPSPQARVHRRRARRRRPRPPAGRRAGHRRVPAPHRAGRQRRAGGRHRAARPLDTRRRAQDGGQVPQPTPHGRVRQEHRAVHPRAGAARPRTGRW